MNQKPNIINGRHYHGTRVSPLAAAITYILLRSQARERIAIEDAERVTLLPEDQPEKRDVPA